MVERIGGRKAALQAMGQMSDTQLNKVLADKGKRLALYDALGFDEKEQALVEHAENRAAALTKRAGTELTEILAKAAGGPGMAMYGVLKSLVGGIGADGQVEESSNSIAGNLSSIEQGISAILSALTNGEVRLNVETGELERTDASPAEAEG